MTLDDVPHGMRLKRQARFNQTEADWRRFLELQPDGCFVAELEGTPVGTVTNCRFGPIGWIAMMLVEESHRRRGIGTHLMRHALAYLDASGVRTARLDATPRGRPIYEKLGFVAEYELARWEGAAPRRDAHDAIVPVDRELLSEVLALDAEITATPRQRLIERLYHERPDAMVAYRAHGELRGYLTWREGENARQIGPGVALGTEAGIALGDALVGHSAGKRIFVDVPVDNAPATAWAESLGLTVQRPFTRMRRGEPVADQPAQLWASSGPEKG